MAKIIIEIDDEVITNALQQLLPATTGSTESIDSDGEDYTPDKIKELCGELKDASDAKTLKEVLSEYDVTTPAKAMKLEDDDLQDLGADLEDAIEEAGGGAEEDEITVDSVKEAVQAFTKENGKKKTEKILKEYNIKSVRNLDKLDQEDLEDLFADVTE